MPDSVKIENKISLWVKKIFTRQFYVVRVKPKKS